MQKVTTAEHYLFPLKPEALVEVEVVGEGKENLAGKVESSNHALAEHTILVR